MNRNDSTAGRWLTPDPAGLGAVDLSNPQSWNAYSYALNNPTTLTDPEGTNVHVCVDTDNGSNSQNCFNLSDEQYASLLQQQNGQLGINLPTGNFPTGNITCGGQVCGTASYYEQGLEDQTVNLLAFGSLVGGVARGAIALGEEGISALGRMIGVGAEESTPVVTASAVTPEIAEVGEVVNRAVATVGNQSIRVSSRQVAEDAADEFVGPGARPIRAGRSTGGIIGKISADGQRVARYTSAGGPNPYINLENKITGGNLHVRF